MSVLSWGKPTIEWATSESGAPTATWTALDTPKQDTTVLTPTAGDEVTANEEGGDVVDVRVGKTTYQFEFDLFVKKGGTRPWADDNGVITGEYGIRLTPEDEACIGIQIDRCTLHVEENYTAADGITLHYVAHCLKPATGNTIKEYTKA